MDDKTSTQPARTCVRQTAGTLPLRAEFACLLLGDLVGEPLIAAYLSAHRTMINGSALCAALAVTERD
jgi:hypothetical protein